jgi:hypothetical protein
MSEFDEYESLPEASALTHMIAGSLAGVGEHVAMYPVDSIKVITSDLFSSPTLDVYLRNDSNSMAPHSCYPSFGCLKVIVPDAASVPAFEQLAQAVCDGQITSVSGYP